MRWLPAGVVVATTLAACTAGSQPSPHVSQPVHQVIGRPAPTVAPIGPRPVTFHGLTIFVPASWATNAVKCGAPLKNTVFIGDGAQDACGSIGSRPFSEAAFDTWTPGRPDIRLHRHSLTIDGHRATLGTGVADGSEITELTVADISARLVVTSPSSTVGARLVRTAQITQTDANGCPSTMAYVDLTSPPTRGPATSMVAGRPTAVVVCRYLATYLEQGSTLSSADGTHLVDTLNALPPGLSEARRSTYSPTLCRGSGHTDGDGGDLENLTIRVSHAHGPRSLVYVRLSLCGALGFSNGTRTGQRTTAATELLAKLSGVTSWQGGVHPR